jgi:hypothetical protein
MRLILALVVVAIGAGAFFAGRASVDRHAGAKPARGSFAAGVLAGREAAFSGFDGGWAYGEPYIVTLRRGGPGITYRFDRRRPLVPGVEYRLCGRAVCTRPVR